MSMVAIIPVANILTANDTLNNTANTPGKKSHGPNNFSVPAYTGAAATHGALHSWSDPVFEAAVKAIPNVVWEISDGDPVTRTQAPITAQGAKWGAQVLICRIGEPGVVCAWWQSIYAFDAPKLVNPFTGKPDQRTHNGFTWKVTQADGSGNNVWEPGVFGWTKV